MSRPTPVQPYGYAPPNPAVPSSYYCDDQEEYVGDYSENDALSERAPRLIATPNVTEIYRRKTAAARMAEHYRQQNLYAPSSYYYEAVCPQVQQQMRKPAVPTAYRRHAPVVDERGQYYTSGALEEERYNNSVVYSSPQIASVQRSTTHATPMTRHVVRRHPVTVRTPRYYKRPAASNVYKKPSALCLPVACQPDPAVYRRNTRKHCEKPICTSQQLAFAQQTHPRPVIRRHSVPVEVTNTASEPRKPPSLDYSGDLHMTQSDVDAVLARYETILGDNSPETPPIQKVAACSSKSSINSKFTKRKLVSNMKPKVPFSIKQKQERLRKPQENIKSTPTREKQKRRPNSPRLEFEEITTDVLDCMLSELMNSGCKNKIIETPKENPSDVESTSKSECYEKKVVQRSPSGNSKVEPNQYSNSFNYRDISQNMSKSQHKISQHNISPKPVSASETSSPPSSPRFEPPAISRSINSNTVQHNNSNAIPQSSPKPTNCHADYQNSVMELHRSKSYIVSLIDRALSKELGTVSEKSTVASPSPPHLPPVIQENEQMTARQAINLINKNFDKMDKGLYLEITQALNESAVPNAVTSCTQTEEKHATCSCNVQDEPLYVKQLKQLRWGHLKHIQREVKRLEDLERFLDSCSSASPM